MPNVPTSSLPQGDLARATTHEMNDDWPVSIEIVAYFGENRRRSKRVEISADEFFGRGGHHAPMTGDQIIGIINRLRRQG